MTTNMLFSTADYPEPWPLQEPIQTFPWLPAFMDDVMLFIAGIAIVAGIGFAAWYIRSRVLSLTPRRNRRTAPALLDGTAPDPGRANDAVE